jgi:hypothetical protein
MGRSTIRKIGKGDGCKRKEEGEGVEKERRAERMCGCNLQWSCYQLTKYNSMFDGFSVLIEKCVVIPITKVLLL